MKRLITLTDIALAHRLGWKLEEEGIVSTVTVDGTGMSMSAQVWIASAEEERSAREVMSTIVPVEMQRDTRCPVCKYDLRGHTGRTKCPECGAGVQAGDVPAVECVHCHHVFHSTVMNATCPKCRRRADEKVGDVYCPRCGEVVPANFEACWKCGLALTRGDGRHAPMDICVRRAVESDLSAILDISNHYARTTPANFAVEPESMESWRRDFEATHEKYPWLVAEAPPPSEGGGREGGVTVTRGGEHSVEQADSDPATHPLTPSLGGRGDELDPQCSPRTTLFGFAKSSSWKGRCAYAYAAETTVYVRPEQHGRGIGRQLYSALLEIMRRQGFHVAVGGITLPNDASVRLHESLGFRKVAEFPRIGWKFDKWHDVGYWAVELRPKSETPRQVRPVAEVAGEVSQSLTMSGTGNAGNLDVY